MKRTTAVLALSILASAVFATGSTANASRTEGEGGGPIAYVGFEQSGWRSNTSCCRWLHDPWTGNVFRLPLQGTRAYRHAWVSNTIANEGRRSLGVRLDHHPTRKEKQRAEFELSNRDRKSVV